jgi:S1-C subfamily serine protease
MSKHLAFLLGLGSLFAFVAVGSAWAQDDPQNAPRNPPSRASIGIGIEPTPADAQHPGLVIRELRPNGPAARAGLESGDILTKVDDQNVKTYEDLANIIGKHKPGDKISFRVLRDGKEVTKSVTLGQRNVLGQEGGETPRGRAAAFLGIQLGPLTQEARNRVGEKAENGALVTDVLPNTPAAKAGLEAGDVITQINTKAVTDPEEVREAIRGTGPGKQVTLQVMRGNEKKELKATLEQAPAEFGFGRPTGRYGEGPPGFPMIQDLQKIPQLERRIEQLERRLRDLEQKSGQSGSKTGQSSSK